MAGILKRFGDIMSANINALLDKAEDPVKMVDQYLRDLESDLGKVKAETAAVMADAARAERELNECSAEITKMQTYAERAVAAGSDDDAKQFLAKKSQLVKQQESYRASNEVAQANAEKMRSMHDKLVKDIQGLNERKDAIKAKMAVAKTQQNMTKIGSSVSGAANSMSAFDRMEAKADRMLDEANAMAELNTPDETESIDELSKKYDGSSTDPVVEDELAALKARLGK